MPTAGKNIKASFDDLSHTLDEKVQIEFSIVKKIKDHIYHHRAKYTALVTIPTTAVVMNKHYKPYVDTAKVMAVFIHDNNLGQRFLEVTKSINEASKI